MWTFFLRGAIAGTAGGVLFVASLQQGGRLPGGIAVWLAIACACLGLVTSTILGTLRVRDDSFKRWATLGWALGGLAFYGTFIFMMRSSLPGPIRLVSPAVVAGLIGGLGFGYGWERWRTAPAIAIVSAILMPASFWVSMWLMQHGGAWAAGFIPMIGWVKFIVWAFSILGFTIYGALLGIALGFFDHDEYVDVSSTGPSSNAFDDEAESIALAGGRVAPLSQAVVSTAVPGGTIGVASTHDDDHDPFLDGGDDLEAFRRRRQASGVHKPAPQPVDHGDAMQEGYFRRAARIAREDEVALEQDADITPYDDDEDVPTLVVPELGSDGRSDDVSEQGTFRASRRNFHPDYQPGSRGDGPSVGRGGMVDDTIDIEDETEAPKRQDVDDTVDISDDEGFAFLDTDE